MSVNNKQLLTIVNKMQQRIQENRDFLSNLDREIGDGDHGINMDRGFQEVVAKLETMQDADVSTILRTTGMTLAFKVGGASGPLYGTAFMKAADVVKGKSEIEASDFPLLLEAAIGGIQLRGKAIQGEKTMLDSIMPAQAAAVKALAEGKDGKACVEEALAAAEAGAEFTKTIKATKGRASYVGDRSIGHMDPGAASAVVLLKALAECLN